MAGKELTCVDKSGRPLAGSVQEVHRRTIPGRSRTTVRCRVNDSQISGVGVVESAHTSIQLASSLNRLTDRGNLGAVRQPLLGGGHHTVQLHSGPVLLRPGEGHRAVAR